MVTGVGRSSRRRQRTWLLRFAVALPLAGWFFAPSTSVAAAGVVSAPTTSHYEPDASATDLYLQGEEAGQAGAQGIVILDFGRPASDGTSDGTLDFGQSFLSFADISVGVESYIEGYYDYAPAGTTIDVAVGTNDSCGMFQPCGTVVCGCPDEPANYVTWGQELAATVEQLRTWSAQYGSANGFTDTVRVVAGDDAEPAFDPGYYNTYDVMEGYAAGCGRQHSADGRLRVRRSRILVRGSAPPSGERLLAERRHAPDLHSRTGRSVVEPRRLCQRAR